MSERYTPALNEEKYRVIDQDFLFRSVADSIRRVFSMMLDMEVQGAGTVSDRTPSDTGLISFVGITGGWSGSGVFCCSPALGSLISARLVGGPVRDFPASVDDDVLDAVAEVTNMMIGNINNALEPVTGPLAMSVPTVIHGRNFRFRNAGSVRSSALSFETEGEQFEVRMGLAPGSQQPIRLRIPILGLAHM